MTQKSSAEHSPAAFYNADALPPVQTRRERLSAYSIDELNPVSSRSAEWRFSPLDRIEKLTSGDRDGSEIPAVYDITGAASVNHVPMSDPLVGRCGCPEEVASALAWHDAKNALIVTASAQDASEVWITRESLGGSARAGHTVIDVAPFAKTTIVFDNRGDALLSENVEIYVGESAQVVVVNLQQWNPSAVHLASHFCRISANASLTHAVITLGGGVVRINPTAHLAENAGSATLLGLYTADAGSHIESQVFVNHDAPNTVSRVSYKGALRGAGARTVWIGDVLIGREATGTDSYEQNRNLILAEGARADSVPNLEIETGDIVGAGHASATGRFDDEQLFYLRSRGITEHEARQLVVRGFLNEVLALVPVPRVQAIVHDALDEALEEVTA
jgi:Fe-S cluster assembly protein SufD